MPEGLTLGASGLVSRQMKRGDRGSVPASRTFAEMFECEASGRDSGDCDATACVRRANGWTKNCLSLHSAKNRGSERHSRRARSMARPTPDWGKLPLVPPPAEINSRLVKSPPMER